MPAAWDKIDWPVVVMGVSALGGSVLVAMLGNFLFNWTFTSGAIYAAAILFTGAELLLMFISYS